MGKYGEVAVIAIQLINANKASNPVDAWEIAVNQVYPHHESSRKKGCPRNTFLGICEEGLVVGTKPGNYTHSLKNKSYALKALSLLKMNNNAKLNAKKLWELVVEDNPKQHNSQMDIVITLWERSLINSSLIP